MSTFLQFTTVIEPILAAREDIAACLGDEWPDFKAKLADALQVLASADDDDNLKSLVDDLLNIGLQSAAKAIFESIRDESIMLDVIMDGDLVVPPILESVIEGRIAEAGDLDLLRIDRENLVKPYFEQGWFEPNDPDLTVIMTPEQFRARVQEVIDLWAQPLPKGKLLEKAPRYLNAAFFQANSAQPVPLEKPLSFDYAPYRLAVNISPTFWGPGAGDIALIEKALREAHRTQGSLEMDVVVRSDKILVTPSQCKLTLPATGESTLIYFDLILREVGRQTLEIDLMFHGHLLQSRRIEVEVVTHAGQQLPPSAEPVQDGWITFTRIARLTADSLAPLAHQPRRLTIVAERDIDYNRIRLHFYDNTGDSLDIQESELTDNNLTSLIQNVRKQLLAAMNAYTGCIGSSEKVLTKYLGLLATVGRNFYRELLPDLNDNEVKLGEQKVIDALQPKTVIQVAPLSVQLSIPWEVLYERKVHDYHKDHTKLCTTFREHGPDDCPHANNPEVVCPHGFWGYRYIIEQLPCRVSRQPQKTSASLPLFIHNKVPLHFSAFVYPHLSLFNSHWANIQRLAPASSLKLVQVTTFDQIRALLAKQNGPDLVYFYAHGGRNQFGAPCLKVGDEEITENNLDAWRLDWRESRPLVVLNACGSADYTPDSFANLLDFFWQRGAAGMIATQCGIREKLADALIIPFFKAFLRQEPAGEALFKARRQLLYEHLDPRGLAYSLFADAEVKLAQPVVD